MKNFLKIQYTVFEEYFIFEREERILKREYEVKKLPKDVFKDTVHDIEEIFCIFCVCN